MALTVDQLKDRAKPWTEPISADRPTGQLARADPSYEAVLNEIAKLESLAGGAVDWNLVVERCSSLLKVNTKDLLLACYLAAGLHATKDIEGLVTGLAVVGELIEQYWPTLFPELSRVRARANALGWLFPRTANLLGQATAPPSTDLLETLSTAVNRLAELTRSKLEDKAPATGALVEAVKRLQLSAPVPEAPPPAPAASVAAPSPAAPAPLPSTPAPPSGLTAEGVTDFLRQVGASLVTAGTALFQANPADPSAYRLSRLGLWLHVAELPPRGPTGRTQVPPLPAPTRTQLETLAANGRWSELLAEAEGALGKYRFCLDLQHYSARALQGLGPAHQPSKVSLLQQLRQLLERLPSLPEQLNADGTAFAAPATRSWLDDEVLARPQAPSAPLSTIAPAAAGPDLDEVLTLEKEGRTAEAIARLQAKIASSASARDKFALRLRQAKLCAEGGQLAVARGLYAALDRECVARGLDEWEPTLAIGCLEGLLTSSRLGGKALPAELAGQYYRLCQLDPAVAFRIGGERT